LDLRSTGFADPVLCHQDLRLLAVMRTLRSEAFRTPRVVASLLHLRVGRSTSVTDD